RCACTIVAHAKTDGNPTSDSFVSINPLEIEMPPDILDSNSIEVRRAVSEYQRSRAGEDFASEIIKRVGGRDEFYVELAGHRRCIPMTSCGWKRLLCSAPRNGAKRRVSLPMRAPASQVIALISSPDAVVRAEATNCASFNQEADSIAEKLPEMAEGFRLAGRPYFLRQLAIRKRLQQSLDETAAELRSWRMSIADHQPDSLLSQGLRFWIREQRYASALNSGG
ncbi:hypothetical protein NKH60_34770, partial [Mesorhizobium sp. M1006]|uniref:hypothetical protein n=1 Tax=Mesorhizobium sp. M1006 TaxID=2957048 RepID=UPI0033390507